MGKVSILKATCLAIERWYCIFRPMKYKRYFTRRRLFLYILAIWVCACLLQINKFFEWKLSGSKCSKAKAPYGEKGTQAIITIYSLIGVYIIILFILYRLGFIWPYHTIGQIIANGKMLRRATKGTTESLTTYVCCDVDNVDMLLASSSNSSRSFSIWHHYD